MPSANTGRHAAQGIAVAGRSLGYCAVLRLTHGALFCRWTRGSVDAATSWEPAMAGKGEDLLGFRAPITGLTSTSVR